MPQLSRVITCEVLSANCPVGGMYSAATALLYISSVKSFKAFIAVGYTTCPSHFTSTGFECCFSVFYERVKHYFQPPQWASWVRLTVFSTWENEVPDSSEQNGCWNTGVWASLTAFPSCGLTRWCCCLYELANVIAVLILNPWFFALLWIWCLFQVEILCLRLSLLWAPGSGLPYRNLGSLEPFHFSGKQISESPLGSGCFPQSQGKSFAYIASPSQGWVSLKEDSGIMVETCPLWWTSFLLHWGFWILKGRQSPKKELCNYNKHAATLSKFTAVRTEGRCRGRSLAST